MHIILLCFAVSAYVDLLLTGDYTIRNVPARREAIHPDVATKYITCHYICAKYFWGGQGCFHMKNNSKIVCKVNKYICLHHRSTCICFCDNLAVRDNINRTTNFVDSCMSCDAVACNNSHTLEDHLGSIMRIMENNRPSITKHTHIWHSLLLLILCLVHGYCSQLKLHQLYSFQFNSICACVCFHLHNFNT